MSARDSVRAGELVAYAQTARRNCSSLAGKAALVVGAGDLGAAGAVGLSVAGADVVVANRTLGRAEDVVDALERPALALHVDVTDATSVATMFEQAVAHLGHLDVLLLAFGTNHRAPAAEMPIDKWEQILAANLTGAFLCFQHAHPVMTRQHSGRMIVVGSAAGHAARAWPPTAAYGASKAGLLHLVRYLATEWASDGITVNAVSPGYFRTRLTEPLIAAPDQLDRLLSLTPMKRLGTLDEFIGPVLFLASDASGFVTGQSLVVDGGRVVV